MSDQKNQNEQEFFAVVATGRKGLEQMAEKMGGEIMQIATDQVRKAGSTWLKKAIVSAANSEAIADVLKTKQGLFSIYKAWGKAAGMGLQMGGQFPHAHLTPYAGKVELIISAEGYKHAAIHGPGAVLSDCEIRRIYEGEEFRIDFAKGEIVHNFDLKKERGKLVGIYGILTKTDGQKSVDFMSKTEALMIRDSHSKAYSAFLAKKISSTPWSTDEDAMIEKTAAKKFLKKYAAESEGLAQIFAGDLDDEEIETPKNNSDRMAAHLEKKVEKIDNEIMGEAEEIEEKTPEEKDDGPELFV